jgi:nuclease S1
VRSAIIVAFPLLLFPLEEARAWGQEGHSIVAEIAQRRLTPAARQKVRDILGGEASLASISSWADDVRDILGKSYNWHFVDIPLNESNYDPVRDCEDTPRGDCAIKAIERNKQVLSDASSGSKKKLEALKFVVHFIGDIHQPLHTVKDYVGGNTYPVTFFVDPLKKKTEATNLHAVWDSNLIRCTVWDWGAYVQRLEEQWLPGKDIDKLSAGTPVDWVLEAHQIAIDVVFTAPFQSDLGEQYLTRARPKVDQQLALAGLRLARTLNELLK